MGPTLQKNMTQHRMTFEVSESSEVMPVDRPTMPKADTVSKKMPGNCMGSKWFTSMAPTIIAVMLAKHISLFVQSAYIYRIESA